ncbi:MAG: YibE/F family protein, partial [Opitutae bacterium]|nr:YibE/F family protein [Opitutae bacterium]
AFAGAMLGVLSGCFLAALFTSLFKINGAVMPYSQALLYSGYEYLNLSDIYIGGIILASSGAVMDLGMDVAAGIEELSHHNPDLSSRELIASGLRIGRSVVGTMTTTLLLAYAGGYLTLMMAFAAQGTSPIDFINNPYVAGEMVKTLVGSFALVLVAPFTAFAGGLIFGKTRAPGVIG